MIDADRRTLHVRCGSDVRDTLRGAGFGGDSWNSPTRYAKGR
jgi:hypothetical protein